jgi:ABC-type Zn uptake system ZnuABC Zn-binding protein ZnuA
MALRSVLIAALLALAWPAFAQDRLEVVTTTGDLRSLTEAVGGNRVTVTSLVPPNIDAEEYQPKPQDVVRLKRAQLLVRVGLDYDLWLDRLLAQTGRPEIGRGGPSYVDASSAVAVLELRGMSVGPGDGHAHGSGNPHYWLDPKNAEIITANILEALARIDAANAAAYEANRQAFLARLSAKLDEWESSPITTAGHILRAASGWISLALSRRSPACRRAPHTLQGLSVICMRAVRALSCASRKNRNAMLLSWRAGQGPRL